MTGKAQRRAPEAVPALAGPRPQEDVIFDFTIFYNANGVRWSSVEHMRHCLSNLEWLYHAAYLRYRNELEEEAMKRAQRKGGRRG